MNWEKCITIFLIILVSFYLLISCNPGEPVSPQAVITKEVKHNENIITHEVWNSDKTHIIAAAISIDHATLMIKPGTTVQFEKGAALSVMDSAGLIADGSIKPILFSTNFAEKGAWNYIYFSDHALDDSCRLINCHFEYGGGENGRSAMIFCEHASPTITGCEISNSRNSGITLYGDCRGIEFHSNIISNCDFVPIQTYAINVSSIGNNVYQHNGLDQIRIIEGSVERADNWPNPSIPYRLADGLTIKYATLTIEPAAEFIVEYDEAIIVSDMGSLQAVGTPSEKIIFTASNVGDWKGIVFNSTADDVNSKLIHCVIENGGLNRDRPANIVLDHASPEISNCIIQQSIGYGVFISGKMTSNRLPNNIIRNNVYCPISISANAVTSLSPGYYLSNGTDVIEVRGGTSEELIKDDGYWDNIGMPYRVTGTVQIQASTVILAPGNTLQMTENSSVEILTNGGFIADGTSEMIRIEGIRQSPGIWKNIYFNSNANANNCQLINCRISSGGGDVTQPGMIYCDHIAPIIRNCIIEYSQAYGIYITGNVLISDLNSNHFDNNGYGNYFQTP